MLLHSWAHPDGPLTVERLSSGAYRIANAASDFSIQLTEQEAFELAVQIAVLLPINRPVRIAA